MRRVVAAVAFALSLAACGGKDKDLARLRTEQLELKRKIDGLQADMNQTVKGSIDAYLVAAEANKQLFQANDERTPEQEARAIVENDKTMAKWDQKHRDDFVGTLTEGITRRRKAAKQYLEYQAAKSRLEKVENEIAGLGEKP